MPEIDELVEEIGSLNQIDEDGFSEAYEKIVQDMIEFFENVPKSQIKSIPDEIKEALKALPEKAVHSELYKKLK